MAPSSKSPGLTRFLSDFTLGFSDGLTVPFALTAGLSSLGRADTVIYAGLAELCAGSISMGIGGYLAALDEVPAEPSAAASDGDEEELKGMLHSASSSDDGRRESLDEKASAQEQLVLRHLEPLELPGSAVANILASLREQPGRLDRAASQLESHNSDALCQQSQPLPIWPVASGLSISLGYVVGGIIPLLPYFFAATVGLGLRWSIGLCLVALMAFGSGKSWVLGGADATWKRSVWSGIQMLVLGSLAAGAAVLCVHLLGASEGEDGSG
ncbi:hypothetical protein K4F52_008302 [Lecanicillium sp. MT-2017a]|nr:hypothetical protein K4F52_008302 [Lecanicillium sp. MT-2017a]